MSNPLSLVPAKYRGAVYFLASLAMAFYAAYQATNHDWRAAAISVLGSLITAMAKTHTPSATEVEGD